MCSRRILINIDKGGLLQVRSLLNCIKRNKHITGNLGLIIGILLKWLCLIESNKFNYENIELFLTNCLL